jgi:hypothetical protein
MKDQSSDNYLLDVIMSSLDRSLRKPRDGYDNWKADKLPYVLPGSPWPDFDLPIYKGRTISPLDIKQPRTGDQL